MCRTLNILRKSAATPISTCTVSMETHHSPSTYELVSCFCCSFFVAGQVAEYTKQNDCNLYVFWTFSPNTLSPPNTRFYDRIHHLGLTNLAEYTYLGAEYTETIAEYTEIRPNTRRCIRQRPRRIHGETVFWGNHSFGAGETLAWCIRRRQIHHCRTRRVPYLTLPYRTLPYLTVPYRTVQYSE